MTGPPCRMAVEWECREVREGSSGRLAPGVKTNVRRAQASVDPYSAVAIRIAHPIAARTRFLLEVTGDTVFNDVQRPCSAMWLVTGLEGEEGRWSTHDRYSSPRLGRGVSCGFGRLLSAHADAVVSACGQWSRGVHHRVGTAEDRSYSVGSRRRRRIRSSVPMG